jgi:hypothetical protein
MADLAMSSAMTWTALLHTRREPELFCSVWHSLQSAFISPTGWLSGIALLANHELCESHQLVRWNVETPTPCTCPTGSSQEKKNGE